MKKLFKRVFELVELSVYEKRGGKVSSGRLSSYFILGAILTAAGVFIGIDIVNAVMAILNKGYYEIPANHIVFYGMTLAHHLTLLGINKNTERKVEVAVQEQIKSLNQLNPKDMSTAVPEDEEISDDSSASNEGNTEDVA
jgi:hypothetical protein